MRLDFKKGEENRTLLDDQENIEKLQRWVMPIIERNEGWGTGELTPEEFEKHPEKFQDHIDATTWGNVHVLLEGGEPVALLEFGKTRVSDMQKKKHRLLAELLKGEGIEEFERAVRKKLERERLEEMGAFLSTREIYTGIGVVLRPDLQGKKSGLSEKLYNIVADGICLGWTSNPVIVRQRRKIFRRTLYFPPWEEFPNGVEEWAACLYVYLYRLDPGVKDEVEGFEFGTMSSTHFVESRGGEYLKMAEAMRNEGKISELDEKRIKYVLGRKCCAAAIVSWN